MNDLDRKRLRADEIRAEIASIHEEIGWGMKDDEHRLPELEEELACLELDIEIAETEAGLDAAAGSTLSIDRLNRFEAEKRAINRHLDNFGRRIAEARGEPLPSDAFLHSHERNIADKWAYRDWPTGTRLLTLTYQIPQRYEPGYQTITFPESYLDTDWRPAEQARDEAAQAKAAAEKAEEQRKREERERAELDRLKAKYE